MSDKNIEGSVEFLIKLIKKYEDTSNKKQTQLVKFLIMQSQKGSSINFTNKLCEILKKDYPEYYYRIEKLVNAFELPLLGDKKKGYYNIVGSYKIVNIKKIG